MNRLQFTIRAMLVATLFAAVALAVATLQIRKLNRVTADVVTLRIYRANVDVLPNSSKIIATFAPRFAGYPTNVRKYFDTPDLVNVDNFIDIIARNPTITKLTIDGSQLEDNHVQRLLRLPLLSLHINQCSTGDTLNAVASTTLRSLGFQRTRLNDCSLKALGTLSEVRSLDLTRTRVSDDSIHFISELPSLKTLTIRRCKITKTGKIRLEELRPDLAVHWEPLRN
jgi:Leucine-rich repeat (LRR) protein